MFEILEVKNTAVDLRRFTKYFCMENSEIFSIFEMLTEGVVGNELEKYYADNLEVKGWLRAQEVAIKLNAQFMAIMAKYEKDMVNLESKENQIDRISYDYDTTNQWHTNDPDRDESLRKQASPRQANGYDISFKNTNETQASLLHVGHLKKLCSKIIKRTTTLNQENGQIRNMNRHMTVGADRFKDSHDAVLGTENSLNRSTAVHGKHAFNHQTQFETFGPNHSDVTNTMGKSPRGRFKKRSKTIL